MIERNPLYDPRLFGILLGALVLGLWFADWYLIRNEEPKDEVDATGPNA